MPQVGFIVCKVERSVTLRLVNPTLCEIIAPWYCPLLAWVGIAGTAEKPLRAAESLAFSYPKNPVETASKTKV